MEEKQIIMRKKAKARIKHDSVVFPNSKDQREETPKSDRSLNSEQNIAKELLKNMNNEN